MRKQTVSWLVLSSSNEQASAKNPTTPTPKDDKTKGNEKGGSTGGGSPVPDVGLSDKAPLALTKGAAEDVAGSLKVHIKIALEIDIQITARIKGKSFSSLSLCRQRTNM